MDNHTKQTDPSVEYLVQMFPEEFLRNLGQKTGLIKRLRKIDPVIFFWVLILGFGVDFLRSIRALERRYEVEANIELSDGALYDRFKPELVVFLRECVLHAIEFQAQQQSRVLGEKLNGFKDITEKANRYTHLRWAKVFGENAHRLLKEVLEYDWECIWIC